jgi:hypothetical protein
MRVQGPHGDPAIQGQLCDQGIDRRGRETAGAELAPQRGSAKVRSPIRIRAREGGEQGGNPSVVPRLTNSLEDLLRNDGRRDHAAARQEGVERNPSSGGAFTERIHPDRAVNEDGSVHAGA